MKIGKSIGGKSNSNEIFEYRSEINTEKISGQVIWSTIQREDISQIQLDCGIKRLLIKMNRKQIKYKLIISKRKREQSKVNQSQNKAFRKLKNDN